MRFIFSLVAIISFLAPSAHALRLKDGQVILDKLDDYPTCQNHDYSGDFCHDALVRWVETHPTDAFQAGKMTRKIMNAWVAVPFFTKAFSSGKTNCKDEDVKLAVVSALDLPADSNADVLKQAKKIGIEQCYSEFKSSILDSSTLTSYTFKNICKDLIAKGDLTGLKAKKCSSEN